MKNYSYFCGELNNKIMDKIILLANAVVVDSNLVNYDHLTNIQEFTRTTAQNTTFEFWWDGFNILIAVIALLFSFFTYLSQKNTSDNTQKISQDTQRNLLLDLVRHLYRNLVITYTIKTKLEDIVFDGYPSEEHLVKLKIPMENMHLEAFYGNGKKYEVMHNLYLNLRNYNYEIDTALMHFKDKSISVETKQRDLKTLLLKPSFLTKRILITIYELWELKRVSDDFYKDGYDKRIETMLDSSKTALDARNKILEAQKGKNNANNNTVLATDYNFERYSDKDSTYAKILFAEQKLDSFLINFNKDVFVERGLNEQGGEKVYIIPFKA